MADWWLEQLDPWGRDGVPVSAFVPRSFPAVCRVLHPWYDQAGTRLTWSETSERVAFPTAAELVDVAYGQDTRQGDVSVIRPHAGELDPSTAAALVGTLGEATATPDDVLAAVWVGWGDVPHERFPDAAYLDTEGRGHFLLRGPLTGLLRSVSAIPDRDQPVSGIWWPADRSWFVATEIDFPWTLVAGSHRLVERLLRHPDLEVAAIRHDDPANRSDV